MTDLPAYPHLAHFLDGYLHQDWTLLAEDLPDVIRSFLHDEPPDAVARLRADIARFVADHAEDLDAAYAAAFPNGVLPAAWDMDSAAWFQLVDRMLANYPRPLAGEDGA